MVKSVFKALSFRAGLLSASFIVVSPFFAPQRVEAIRPNLVWVCECVVPTTGEDESHVFQTPLYHDDSDYDVPCNDGDMQAAFPDYPLTCCQPKQTYPWWQEEAAKALPAPVAQADEVSAD